MKRIVLAVLMVCMTWSLALAAAQGISSREAKNLLEKNKNILEQASDYLKQYSK